MANRLGRSQNIVQVSYAIERENTARIYDVEGG